MISHLLDLDPTAGVDPPTRGRWKPDARISRRRNTIDLPLLQAGTALRISEALQITCRLVEIDGGGVMHICVTKEIAKTGVARRVPVPDPGSPPICAPV